MSSKDVITAGVTAIAAAWSTITRSLEISDVVERMIAELGPVHLGATAERAKAGASSSAGLLSAGEHDVLGDAVTDAIGAGIEIRSTIAAAALGCQGRDDVELLDVEQDEEPGDPVGWGRYASSWREPSRVCPPAVLVERPGRAVWPER